QAPIRTSRPSTVRTAESWRSFNPVAIRGDDSSRTRRTWRGPPAGARHRARADRVRFNGDMFTGLVREVGLVRSVTAERPTLAAPVTAAAPEIGASIAVDGACLTVVERSDSELQFDAVPETLARTSLGRLGAGSTVNLEPALRAGDAL